MTANDLNSRINLQLFCESNGHTGYDFVKMPRFGWFAIDRKTEEIRTLIDFIPLDEMVEFCNDLILEKTQYHDCRIMYNEYAVTKLCNDIRILLTFKRFHQSAVNEYHEGQAYTSGRNVNLAKMFRDTGMEAFGDTGVGVITNDLIEAYRAPLGLPSGLVNKLLIPTWATPKHFCSLEVCKIDSLQQRKTLFMNGEKGWYGAPVKTIYGNIKHLLTHQGCTWDKKLNYWITKVLDLDESIPVSQCLQIWTEARDLKFKRSPLDIIEAVNGMGKLKFNVNQLTFSQIDQLEKRFNVKLADIWRTQKQAQVTIGRVTFIAKDMRYYAESSDGTLQEFTNFMIEVSRIKKKKDGVFYRQGIVYYEGKQEPFEFPNDVFLSVGRFFSTINHFFLNRGLGIPIVSNIYMGYLLEVVNRLNMGTMIDAEG